MMDRSGLPTFLVIGAMKSATTSLHYNLSRHPDILMSSVKEINFFSKYWKYGPTWYRYHFRKTNSKNIGESTTFYSRLHIYPKVPERIYSLIPSSKFIYLVREPLQRAASHYFYNLLHPVIKTGHALPEREFTQKSDFIMSSDYSFQINGYLKFFPKKNFLVVKTSDLRAQPGSAMNQIFDFLNTAPFYHPDFLLSHNEHSTLPAFEFPLKVSAWKAVKAVLDRGYLIPKDHIRPLLLDLKRRNQSFHDVFGVKCDYWYDEREYKRFEEKFLKSLRGVIS